MNLDPKVQSQTHAEKQEGFDSICEKYGEKFRPLFDAEYYLKTYPDIASAGVDPFTHYLEHGGFEGRNPSDHFNSQQYLDAYQDVANAGMNPLLHYIQFGANEGRNEGVVNDDGKTMPEEKIDPAKLLFDENFYLSSYPDIAEAGVDAFEHFMTFGFKEERRPNPYFDAHFYENKYAEELDGFENPFLHYAQIGHAKGFQAFAGDVAKQIRITNKKPESAQEKFIDENDIPAIIAKSGLFDTEYYRRNYPDLENETDLIGHYVRHGESEGRKPNFYFDPEWYKNTFGPFDENTNLLHHYATKGEANQNRPSVLFDTGFYLAKYLNNDEDKSALSDYLAYSNRFRNAPNQFFDPKKYLEEYQDIAAARIDPFEHFFLHGVFESREGGTGINFDQVFYEFLGNDRTKNPLLFLLERDFTKLPKLKKSDGEDLFSLLRRFNEAGPYYEEFMPINEVNSNDSLAAFAVYNPQYINFGETLSLVSKDTPLLDVKKGIPRFKGHFQPNIPLDTTHYFDAFEDVFAKQISLAKSVGLHGFCFSFSERNETIVKRLAKEIGTLGGDFKYMIVWNCDNDQSSSFPAYGNSNDSSRILASLMKTVPFLNNPNYYSINKRPVFIIRDIAEIPDCRATITAFRQALVNSFAISPYILCGRPNKNIPYAQLGFDGIIDFPIDSYDSELMPINDNLEFYDTSCNLEVKSWDELKACAIKNLGKDAKAISCATIGKDDELIAQGSGKCYFGANPAKFEDWVRRAKNSALKRKFEGQNLLLIESWNDLGNSCALEPNRYYGYAYLNSLARALKSDNVSSNNAAKKIVLFVGEKIKSPKIAEIIKCLGHDLVCEIVIIKDKKKKLGSLDYASDLIYDLDFHAPNTISDLQNIATALKARDFDKIVCFGTVNSEFLSGFISQNFSVVALIFGENSAISAIESDFVQICDRIAFANIKDKEQYEILLGDNVKKSLIAPYLGGDNLKGTGQTFGLRQSLGIDENEKIILSSGTPDFAHGLDIFQNIANQAAAQKLNHRFIWVGNFAPKMIEMMRKENEKRGISNIIFDSNAAKLNEFIEISDACIDCSRDDLDYDFADSCRALNHPYIAFDLGSDLSNSIAEAQNVSLCEYGDVEEMLDAISIAITNNKKDATANATSVNQSQTVGQFCDILLSSNVITKADVCALIVTKDDQNLIEGRLGSINSQLLFPEEVFVLDNKSTDNTMEIVDKFEIRPQIGLDTIRSRRNDQNEFELWLKGLSLSQNEFVWLSHGHDSAMPDFISSCIPFFDDDDVGLVFCDAKLNNQKNETILPTYRHVIEAAKPGAFDEDFVFEGREFVTQMLSVRNTIPSIATIIWRRSLLMDVIRAAISLNYEQKLPTDWLMYSMAGLSGKKIGFCAKPLAILHQKSSENSNFDNNMIFEKTKNMLEFLATRLNLDEKTREKQAEYLEELSLVFNL